MRPPMENDPALLPGREKQTPLPAPVIMATTPVATPTAVDSNQEPEVAQKESTSRPASTAIDPAPLAPAAAAVTMAETDVAQASPEEDTKADSAQSPASQNPDPDPDPDDDLEVVVPPAAMVSMTIGGAKTAKKLRRKESPTTTEALPLKAVTQAPDFDDYKSRSPKTLSPGYSPPALPTPQYLDPPPPSPPTNRQATLQRQKMARRLQEQEGTDF